MKILKSLAEAAMISIGVLLLGIVFGASELLFTPLGFGAILATFFLEIFGNRW